jgi:hypothetical protein
MNSPRLKAILATSALALLVALGVVVVEQSATHTDDGCAVEIHCLACRVALSATPDVAHLPTSFVPHLLPAEVVHAAHFMPHASTAVRRLASRGPPGTPRTHVS